MEQVYDWSQSATPITLTVADRERLERVANASMVRFPQTSDYLAREVERARIQADHDSRGFVRMGYCVEFRDDATGQVRRMTLVYPDQADVTAGKISVLTPVGVALIGLSKNQSIEWQTPAGSWRSLTVLSIREADDQVAAQRRAVGRASRRHR
jgi:regulator of nucleoside diphosphate kinase